MSTYIVGDIQGCFEQLQTLLDHIQFNPKFDQLWCVGDLVNRGPHSLETLRFLKNLPHCICVLGNHDLFLLELMRGHNIQEPHTLKAILAAEDREELITWLRHRPIIHYDENQQILMVHAGIPPSWDFNTALTCAHEVETWLQNENWATQSASLYGDKPDQWDEGLSGMDRLRFMMNALTRIRLCKADGCLNLSNRGALPSKNEGEFPWFERLHPTFDDQTILFGHWSALGEKTQYKNVIGLDTGCVWGNKLTAYRLNDKQFFEVPGYR